MDSTFEYVKVAKEGVLAIWSTCSDTYLRKDDSVYLRDLQMEGNSSVPRRRPLPSRLCIPGDGVYWPYQNPEENPLAARIQSARKYVASHTLLKLTWSNSALLQGDVVQEITKLKQQEGPVLQVDGSATLVQTLLSHDLVDELWLYICPITLGVGKHLFAEGTIAAAFTLRKVKSSPCGVIVASYERTGEVQTGS